MQETSRDFTDRTIGEIVAEDFRTARVFEKEGIDFCCGGNVTLAAACREKGLDPAALQEELAAATSAPPDRAHNYGGWDLAFLADYIVNTHHAYLHGEMRQILAYTRKIAEVHGAGHPEVVEIAEIFGRIVTDMTGHLREEEEVLFPAVRRMVTATKGGSAPSAEDVELIKDTLGKLNEEHEAIGDAVHRIRRLARDYVIPPEVCNTYALTYHKLREFEDDLHKHVHLENNILFPKAAQLRR